MAFDASAFMNSVYNDANATKMKPVPEGEYVGQIQPINEKSIVGGTSQKGNDWARLDLMIEIAGDPRIKEALGVDKRQVRAGIMLDLTESGGLDFGEGRNIKLGRLRAATGLNTPGQPFSWNQFGGKLVKFAVKHRPDDRNPELIYDDVVAFFPVA